MNHLHQEVLDLVQLLIRERPAGALVRHRFLAIAPEDSYSQPGYRRLIHYRRPDGPFAAFNQTEYLVPEAEAGPLVWALLQDPAQLPAFERYRLAETNTRDLLVCTHGSVDAACAKFGYPLYRMLRNRYAIHSEGWLRAWRVTHFGGHVFAPTLVDMPTGHYWAFIEDEQAEQLVHRSGDPARLRGCYRGWCGLAPPFLQVAERELFVKFGWGWLDYPKAGQILDQDEGVADEYGYIERDWANVRIDYASPDGQDRGAYEARVAVRHRIETIYNTGNPATHHYPQYVISQDRLMPPDLQSDVEVNLTSSQVR